MRIKKEIWHGEIIPAWYGVAWVRYDSDSAVCLPLPLNLIAATVRGIWIWMRHGYRSVPSNAMDAYAQGYADGKRSNALS